jgi:mannose/fructose/N-acetylgalactosamine-specific phosphotransferase system component IIC
MGEMIGEILLWVLLFFASGSLLLLERHCLGQRALVQPLVLCLLSGVITHHVETGLWLGVTLQLLSVSPIRNVDWALSGAVTAMTLAIAFRMGATVEVGGPEASLLIMISVIIGAFARSVERVFARIDRRKVTARSPWEDLDSARAVERTVYRAIVRWIVVGGSEALLGIGLALLFVMAGSFLPPSEGWIRAVSSVGCPTLGVAVAISALSEVRLFVWSGASMALSLMVAWWGCA